MELFNTLAFMVFPYIALTLFVVGHAYRYATDLYKWNAKSSQMLESETLAYGTTIFHWGIILTFIGHAGGLLIPQSLYDAVGIDGQAHSAIAYYSGLAVGTLTVLGLAILIVRRVLYRRVRTRTSANDFFLLLFLLLVTGIGTYNVFFGHYYLLDTVAPWIRSIVIFRPEPELMIPVPFSYKLHIITAFALLAYSPFTRLVHIWSVPVYYLYRSLIVFRGKPA